MHVIQHMSQAVTKPAVAERHKGRYGDVDFGRAEQWLCLGLLLIKQSLVPVEESKTIRT
jgi:hypothetical protein